MKLRFWVNESVVVLPATLLGTAAPIVADSPALDLDVKRTDVGAGVDTRVTNDTAGDDPATNPQCAAFQADPNADVGDIIQAGCTPSLAQMSALMDNPLGNVAMLFTQFDIYQMKDPATGTREDKYNYMGIAQFPKGLGENWNLINRIVWNVPSMPLSQSKIDDAQTQAAQYRQLRAIRG